MVKLLRAYGGFAADAYVAFPTDTETALIAQGLAEASTATVIPEVSGSPNQIMTLGGNEALVPQSGFAAETTGQGPSFVDTIPVGSIALTSYETNGVVQVAGDIHLTEIFVPAIQTFTGAAWLNGTTVTTDKGIVALYGADGTLLANSAVAGTTTATASVFQEVAFTAPITLIPGRYFIGVQMNGNTDTLRHILTAFGAKNRCSKTSGVFGTLPASMTVPTTFTTALGNIARLYV